MFTSISMFLIKQQKREILIKMELYDLLLC